MICNHCKGTGFVNLDTLPTDLVEEGHQAVLDWIDEMESQATRLGGCSCHIAPPCSWCLAQHDVRVCNCCGDGDGWYGEPGHHYGNEDPKGADGPYAGNGGLCQCH